MWSGTVYIIACQKLPDFAVQLFLAYIVFVKVAYSTDGSFFALIEAALQF